MEARRRRGEEAAARRGRRGSEEARREARRGGSEEARGGEEAGARGCCDAGDDGCVRTGNERRDARVIIRGHIYILAHKAASRGQREGARVRSDGQVRSGGR